MPNATMQHADTEPAPEFIDEDPRSCIECGDNDQENFSSLWIEDDHCKPCRAKSDRLDRAVDDARMGVW